MKLGKVIGGTGGSGGLKASWDSWAGNFRAFTLRLTYAAPASQLKSRTHTHKLRDVAWQVRRYTRVFQSS